MARLFVAVHPPARRAVAGRARRRARRPVRGDVQATEELVPVTHPQPYELASFPLEGQA